MMRVILILTITRIVVNIGRRFVYPFVPSISRQLNVSLASVQSVIAASAGIGVTSPLFGPVVDRHGRKRMILVSLVMITAGGFFGAAFPDFWVFVVVLFVLGFGKMLYDPSALAYIGDRVPYERRGLALGFNELSWALSLLLAAPLVGYIFTRSAQAPIGEFMLEMVNYTIPVPQLLRDSSGLQTMFLLIGSAALVATIVIWLFIPADNPGKGATRKVVTPLMAWRTMRGNPSAWGSLGYAFTIAVANEIFFINYGIWMEQSFGLVLAALGTVTTVIAIAEVFGEVSVMTLADRIGKRRLAAAGALLSAVMYLVVPHLTFNLGFALFGIFLVFLGTETAIVASIPIFTEVLPDNRAVMITGATGAASSGRLVGAVLGGLLFALTGDFVFIGAVSLVIGGIGFVLMWRVIDISG